MRRRTKILIGAWVIIGTALYLFAFSRALHGQCPGGRCPSAQNGYQVQPEAAQNEAARYPAVVRVWAEAERGQRFGGSGVVCDVEGGLAYVLTAQHTFAHGGKPVVVLHDQRRFAARVEAQDAQADLVLLAIQDPGGITPYPIAETPPAAGDKVWGLGFGSDGQFRQTAGAVTQYVTAQGAPQYPLVEFRGAVREGDSGGPILDTRGCCVGVIKGTDGRVVNGPCLPRIRAVLRWLRPGRKAAVVGTVPWLPAPIGVPAPGFPTCPQPGPTPAPPVPPMPTPAPSTGALTTDYDLLASALIERMRNDPAFRGPPGKDGPPGAAGRDGKDASLPAGVSGMESRLAALEQAIARPIYVGSKSPDGTIWQQPSPVRLGEVMYIRAFPPPNTASGAVAAAKP